MAVRERSSIHGADTQFLDPAVLSRIGNLELLARTVVDGFLQGIHRSPHLGMSLDFAEHREYMRGDDIRRIDWRLFARTDRFYVKLFEAETAADFMVALDVSKSMSFGTHSVSKLDYARDLAAALCFFSQKQRDLRSRDRGLRTSIDTPPATHPAHAGACQAGAARHAA
jgi:uncharacterized protein (DUF58 family)